MALNPSDPYYRAEFVPVSNTAFGVMLRNYFKTGPDSFGNKGNLTHTSGYHRSRSWVLNSNYSQYGGRDYSVQQSKDKGGDGNWVSAFDFTPAAWGSAKNRQLMVQITGNVLAAAKHGDQRLAILREFAGTVDGKNVITFNCADGSLKSPFDSSHLDHVHGSAWRSFANQSFAGVFDIMTGGTAMPSEWHTGEPSGPFLTQGPEGYAGQQRDTALGFTWQAAGDAAATAHEVAGKVDEVLTRLAALEVKVDNIAVGNVDVNALADALLTKMLASPDYAAFVKQQAFLGSQQAEKE